MLFQVDFITYIGVYRSIETEKLNVPTSEGRRTILSNHMPIMLTLETGVIETANAGKVSHYAITSGLMYFKDNRAEIVLDSVIDVEEIDVERAHRDIAASREMLESLETEAEKARARMKIMRAENMLAAVKKYRPDRQS